MYVYVRLEPCLEEKGSGLGLLRRTSSRCASRSSALASARSSRRRRNASHAGNMRGETAGACGASWLLLFQLLRADAEGLCETAVGALSAEHGDD